jgi:FtsZ-interacting cell division protein ZipA
MAPPAPTLARQQLAYALLAFGIILGIIAFIMLVVFLFRGNGGSSKTTSSRISRQAAPTYDEIVRYYGGMNRVRPVPFNPKTSNRQIEYEQKQQWPERQQAGSDIQYSTLPNFAEQQQRV